MTGRGVDQAFRRSVDPRLQETHVCDARRYLELAREAHGPVPGPVEPGYPWGDALEELDRATPDARIANLETAVTDRGRPDPSKGIHYRMHPANVGCLEAARLHACALANNHVLDWGRRGLEDTLGALRRAGIATAGAGEDLDAARTPVELEAGGRRLRVFAFASRDAGVPPGWAAGEDRPGVWRLPDLSEATLERTVRTIRGRSGGDDLLVASVHWGGNWGWEVNRAQRAFARGLVERAGVDVVHGHSSHHPKGMEVHGGRLILYGCGDFVNDYEGIRGHEAYRPELAVMYLPRLEPSSGRLARLELRLFRSRGLRLERASREDVRWLRRALEREGPLVGGTLSPTEGGGLALEPEGVR